MTVTDWLISVLIKCRIKHIWDQTLVENPESWQQQVRLTFRMQLVYLQAYPTHVIQYAAKINIHSVKTTYPDTGMSS